MRRFASVKDLVGTDNSLLQVVLGFGLWRQMNAKQRAFTEGTLTSLGVRGIRIRERQNIAIC